MSTDFRILAVVYSKKYATRKYIINPSYAVCVTALPRKALVMFTAILVNSKCKNVNFRSDSSK